MLIRHSRENKMFRIAVILTICFLLISVYSTSLGQEFQFQPEVESIRVSVNGMSVHSPFAGGSSDFSFPSLVDIDNDGDLDLFVGEAVQIFGYVGSISLYRNRGTLTTPDFAVEIGKSIGGASSAHTFADIDNDGDFDLFGGSIGGPNLNSQIIFYRNTGTVTDPVFTGVTAFFPDSTQTRTRIAPTFADIDADGDLDLFVGERRGNISLYRNTGTPADYDFVLETRNFANIAVGNNSTPSFVDIDNDGDLDLFVGEFDGNINLYHNIGTATDPDFVLETESFADIDVGFDCSLAFADIDADGDFDLLVGEFDGNVNFYINEGTALAPEFTLATENFVNVDVGSDSSPVFVDIDSDEDFDLFIGEENGNINFFRNTGTSIEAAFILETEDFSDIDVGDGSTPAFSDIDNDGDLDMFVGEEAGNINFYRNIGTSLEPVFILETENLADIDAGGDTFPAFADIDNDGDLDLFVGIGGNVSFYRNTGTSTEPTFALETQTFADIDIGGDRTPAFVDIDSDGDLDLFVGRRSGFIDFYRNAGTVTEASFRFEESDPSGIHGSFSNISTPAFVDIDNDGDFDLFVGGSGGLIFYRNTTTLAGDI